MNEGTWFSKWKDLCLAGEREREGVFQFRVGCCYKLVLVPLSCSSGIGTNGCSCQILNC